MKFKNRIYDAFKYTLKDWKAIILLGAVLCIASTVGEFQTDNLTIFFIILIISVTTSIFEEGYRYRIIENTINGNNSPPLIENPYKLMKEGFVEVITLCIYILIMNGINLLIDKLNSMEQPAIALIIFAIGYLFYSFLIASGINKVLHGGKFLSGLNFIEILKLYYKIGLKESIFLIVAGGISINILYRAIFNLNIFAVNNNIIDYSVSFIINPILILFITRLIALCGRETIRD